MADKASGSGFTCSNCSKTYKHRKHLNRHEKLVHTSQKPFKCRHCPLNFSLKEHLKRHHLAKHLGLPIHIGRGSKPKMLNNPRYTCEKCTDKSFVSRWELTRHTKLCHSFDLHCPLCKASECQAKGNIQIDESNVVILESKAVWKSHMQWHRGEKGYLCNECLAGFDTEDSLTTHTLSTHKNMKTLQCLHCKETFSHRNQICRHFCVFHALKSTVLYCFMCAYEVASGEYVKHVALQHARQKSRLCVYCLKHFAKNEDCKAHVFNTHYAKIEQYEQSCEPQAVDSDAGMQCRILLRVHISDDIDAPFERLQLHPFLPQHLVKHFPQLKKVEIVTTFNPGSIVVLQIPLQMHSAMDDVSNELLMTLSTVLDIYYEA